MNFIFADNATNVHCELYIRSFGSISPVTMVSTKIKFIFIILVNIYL